jgi:ATPase subunit of ABC transporter with duplicated ATPase domains
MAAGKKKTTRKKTTRKRAARKKATPKKTTRKKAARKKATPKKTTRKKAARKKAAPKKTTRKKAARKKAAPKKTTRKKTTPRKTAAKKVGRTEEVAKSAKSKEVSAETTEGAKIAAGVPTRIGVVTHYFGRVNAGVISLESGELRVGDTIHVRGHTTDFYQRVNRIEIDHVPVEVARPGQSVGVEITQRVREHDEVFKVSD